MKNHHRWFAAAAFGLGLVLPSLFAGGMCCAVDVNVKMREGPRQVMDSSFAAAIGHFYVGLGEIEKIDLVALREGRPGPEMRAHITRASSWFRNAVGGLNNVLRVCQEERIRADQVRPIEQLRSQLDAIARASGEGVLPDPKHVLDAIRVSTQLMRDAGERAVLHTGNHGHLPTHIPGPVRPGPVRPPTRIER